MIIDYLRYRTIPSARDFLFLDGAVSRVDVLLLFVAAPSSVLLMVVGPQKHC